MSLKPRHPGAALVAVAILLAMLPLGAARAATTLPSEPVNPNLAASCGTDVTLILDRSGSIGTNNTKVQQAAQAFVDAMVGTGSKVQVVSFSTRATAEPGGGDELSDLVFSDPFSLTIPLFTSSGRTNWDDALEMARRSPVGRAPLTVMITDGDPTERNEDEPDGHGGDTEGTGTTTAADLSAAVAEANALKALPNPTHLFVVGVGAAATSSGSEGRIIAISGPDELTFAGGLPNIPFGTADYTKVTEFSALETLVGQFVRELCGPSLNVVKKLQPASGGPAIDATDADPFTFTATLVPGASSWQAPAQAAGPTATLTTSNGVANFKWEPQTLLAPTTITLTEQPEVGWVPNGRRCWLNSLDGTPAVKVVDTVGLNVVGASVASDVPLVIGPYQAMNCEVYNRAVRDATVSVDKVTAPAQQADAFSFSLRKAGTTVHTIPSLTDASPAAAFPAVAPGTYDVVEAPSAHFTQTQARCDDLATQPVEQAAPTGLVLTESAHWQCTFTNALHDGTITIVKDLVGAPTGTFGFTSTIPGHPSFNLQPTAANDASVSYSVAPGTYAVAESAHAPYALSTTCDQGSTPGAIVVTPDHTTTCTFTNTAPAPSLSVTKAALTPTLTEPGGLAAFAVTITNTSVEPLVIEQLEDLVNGTTLDILDLSAILTTCLPLAGTTVAPGATVGCAFVAPASGNAGAIVGDTFTAVAHDADGNDAQDDADASVALLDVAPTLSVLKSTTTPIVAEPGADVVYDVVVSNTSDEEIELVTLTDTIGAGAAVSLLATGPIVTATSCALATIAPHDSYSCSFTTHVTGDAGDVVADTVRAVAVDDDQTRVEAGDDATVELSDVLPNLAVTKTPSPTTLAEPGGPVTFTVGISSLTAEPVVLESITDAVDGGMAHAAGGTCATLIGTTLAGHASTSCTFTVSITADATAGTSSDIVTVGASDDDDHAVSSSGGAVVAISDVAPVIEVTKAALPTTVPEPGGMVTFTVGVTNASDEAVTIDAIVDSVNGGTGVDLAEIDGTCDDLLGTSLAAGGSTSCTFQMFVEGNAGDGVDDEVTVSAGDDDGNQTTGSAEASVTVTDVDPSITVTKVADEDSVDEPGAPVTYTATVTNESEEPVTLTDLSDVVGTDAPLDVTEVEGTTCDLPVVIGVDEAFACTFTLTVTGNAGDDVEDTITATAIDDEDNEAEATADASVTVVDVLPTMTVTKASATTGLVVPGGPAAFTVVVTNTSVEPLTIDEIVDTIGGTTVDVTQVVAPVSATTCATGVVLAPAGSAGSTYDCGFTLTVTVSAAGDLVDVVTVTASDDEDNAIDGDDDAATTIGGRPPLGAVFTDPTTTTVAGRAPLPRTGGDLRGWIVVADVALICGVSLLAAAARRRRVIPT